MPPENKSTVWDIIRFVIITLVIVIPIRAYVAQPFIVSGASMEPTFHPGEYLIIDELSYLLREPRRGEVAVFRYPKDPTKFFIKRIIGLPGETVKVAGNQVEIATADGLTLILSEPYSREFSLPVPITETLAADEYFVLGDNRPVSLDSRFWGAVPRRLIKGRALVRLLPPAQMAILPGDQSGL